MNVTNKENKNTKRTLLIALLVAILLIAGYLVFSVNTKVWPFAQKTTTESTINYSPPTEEEVTNSQDGKKNSADVEEPATDDNNLRSISVDISYAQVSNGQLDIRAFTPDVIEGNGTCTATLTKDSAIVTKTSKGFVDATSTICEPIDIPLSEFSSQGAWSLVVKYTSQTSEGSSEKQEVRI